jgi:hypothetical protein
VKSLRKPPGPQKIFRLRLRVGTASGTDPQAQVEKYSVNILSGVRESREKCDNFAERTSR